jgi:lipoprotein-releasing system permease protein
VFTVFEWIVALRYLRPRRQEGFISVIAVVSFLGIALGVAVLIIVMAVMNGFRQELMSHILGLNGHLSIYGETSLDIKNYNDLTGKIRDIPGVVAVTPIVEGQVMATSRGVSVGAVVWGFRAEDIQRRIIIADNIIAGSLDDFKGLNSVMIGDKMAFKLGLKIGDKITLISPKGNVTAFGTIPRLRAYRIAAIFQIGMVQYDQGYIFMPLAASQIYFDLPEAVNNIQVFVDYPEVAPDVATKIRKDIEDVGRIHDWQRSNAAFLNAIQVERNVMFLILTLIILVAALNIVSSMIMLVKDKGRDIAILRTMGATRGMIMRIFFISGASIGILGTFGGFVLGLSFSLNIETIRQWIQGLIGTDLFAAEIYFLSRLPARVDPSEVTGIVIMGLALSFLATLYPSWRAARLDPAEALRYE